MSLIRLNFTDLFPTERSTGQIWEVEQDFPVW